jgi:hypothetical protein
MLANDRIMSAKPAQFALDEVGMYRFRGSLQKRRALRLVAVMFAQTREAGLYLAAGSSKCCRLFGQYFVPEKVEP